MPKNKTSNEVIAWSNGEGTYIPTPIFYNGVLYTCGDNGVVTAYDGETGERLYRARVGGGGSFSASPVAADARLYFANEDGDIYVAQAGQAYQQDRQERDEGTDHVHAGHLGRRHDRANARARVRDRTEVTPASRAGGRRPEPGGRPGARGALL
jgi:hypothetical protein